ncbi:uncharacterized protein LOC131604698 [Vicia villosa]|uniref:uncharacterized protein LOC131604698 n=1 Tax=Vicia villosa TaxID=3911 RepID=UPI00273C6EAC|nr:uncharacterized protein LOC131604698 [Vicia villosa]
MKILNWNCRGLSSPRAIPNLRKIAQQQEPDIIFLSETLARVDKLESLRIALKFEACFTVDVEGRSGGLAVLWKHAAICSILNFSRNFINVLVQEDGKEDWRITSYYGYPERSRRQLAWDLLRNLHGMSAIPWCIIGDFNDLLSQEDKYGLHPHPNSLCDGFRQAVTDCNLVDMPLIGHQFTWIKSRGTNHVIEERLDRALASQEWLLLHPQATLTNLLASHSDHSPILLDSEPQQRSRKNFQFRFENKWLLEDDIKEVVHTGWRGGDDSALEN